MTDIDYSKNDEFDINNRLFRQARNNIASDNVPIKDLDDEEKGKSNLLIYGSELINNLNQINYTFDQIESLIFKPSKITKKNIKKVIEEGPKATLEDIKEPTPKIEELPDVDIPEAEAEAEAELPDLVEQDENAPELLKKLGLSEYKIQP